MKPHRSVLSGIFWSSIKNWGTRVATLAVFLVVGRLLPPETIGLFFYITGVVTIAGAFGDLGLAEHLVYNKSKQDTQTAIWWFQVGASTLVSGLLLVLVALGAFQVADDKNDSTFALQILICTLPFTAASKVPEALMRHQMNFRSLALRSLYSIVFGSTVAVLLATMGAGLWSLVIKQLVEIFADLFLYFKFSRWHPTLRPRMKPLQTALCDSWGGVGSRLIDAIGQRADAIIIGSALGMGNLGQYSMALRIFQVLHEGIVQPVSGVISTAFAHTKGDDDTRRTFFLTSIEFAATITLPVFALAWSFGETWTPIIFGHQWLEAGNLFQNLAASGLFIGYSGLNGFCLIANNRNREFLIAIFYATSVNVALLFAFSHFSLHAVAFTTLAKAALTFPLTFWLAKNLIQFDTTTYLNKLIPGFLSGIITICICSASITSVQAAADLLGLHSQAIVDGIALAVSLFALGALGIKFLKPRISALRDSLRV